jgi:sensor histidine kinase YesM
MEVQYLNKKIVLAELRDMAILAAAGIAMTTLTCRDCYNSARIFWIVASFTAVMWVLLWKGNSYLASFIDRKISWLEFPVKRLIVGIVLMFIYTFGVLFLVGTTYATLFRLQLIQDAWYSVIITIIISLFMHGRGFFISWKETTIDAEKLKRENIAARYESLKNQVNPHFLFNSFNALTNLVHEDPDKAVKFIKQLSEVYRYVLDTREKEVVSLEEELRFLESYLYLQRIRFGEKLRVTVDIKATSTYIAPLALQMLIENAIKHNVISEDDPLLIRVHDENGFIFVENNLQKKRSLGEPSAKVGLENISRRYDFLSNEKVVISESDSKFVVKIPQLQSDYKI